MVASVLSRQYTIGLVIHTIQQAKHSEKVTDGLVLHSDQEHQHTSSVSCTMKIARGVGVLLAGLPAA